MSLRSNQTRYKALFSEEKELFGHAKDVFTNSSRGSKAEQEYILALSMVQQFNEFMQHDGDGRNTHTML